MLFTLMLRYCCSLDGCFLDGCSLDGCSLDGCSLDGCFFNLNKTPLGETGCLSNPYLLLTGCLDIQFFDYPPFPTQSVRLPLVTYPSLCSTCVTYRTPCHAIGHQVLPTQALPKEVEDFPRGNTYFKHVPPPTYLIYLSPKWYMRWFLFICLGLFAEHQ